MHRYLHHSLKAVTPATGTTWRDFLYIEPSGVRTACAAVVPLLVGQALGAENVFLLIALGGLYTTIVDKSGARLPTLLATAVVIVAAALAGEAVASYPLIDIPLIFCWAFGLGLLAVFGPVAANVGFVGTLVFAVTQGMPPVSPAEQWTRALLFGPGCLWSIVTTLILWKFFGGPSEPDAVSFGPCPDTEAVPGQARRKTLRDRLRSILCHLNPGAPVLMHALRLGIVSLIAVAIQKGFRLDHGHWIIVTALVIVKPDYFSTRKRALERMMGAAVGGIAAILLAAAVRTELALDLLLALLAVLAYSHVRRSYGMYTTFLTPFIVLMLNIGHPGDWELAIVRVGDTLAGGALALTVAVLLRPEKDPVEVPHPESFTPEMPAKDTAQLAAKEGK